MAHRRAVLKAMLAAGAGVSLAGCSSLPASDTPEQEDEAYRLGSEAYVYGYPLIYFAKLRHVRMTRGDPVTGEVHRWGRWAHRDEIANPQLQGAPQTDTFYSGAWLDLSGEPYLMRLPASGGRYWSIQCCDLFGATYGMPNRRSFGAGGVVALVGPDWRGELPKEVTQVYRARMRQSFLVLRMFFANEQDRPAAIALQRRFTLYPLSVHGRADDWRGYVAPPPPPFDPAADKLADLKTLQQMWQVCPPPADDDALSRRFARIGLAPGASGFDGLSAAARRGLARAEAEMRHKMMAATQNFPGTRSANGWIVPKPSVGVYDDRDYLYRAVVTMLGTVATPVNENVYFVAQHEPDGSRLHGDRNYLVRYTREQLPQCSAFWSLHAYRYEHYTLIPNPIHRYSIGDRSEGLRFDPDGGLTLYVQADDPGEARRSNWLPTMRGKEFFLITRAYEPLGAMRKLTWPGPAIARA